MNGIGGCTVAEAKANMPMSEALQWVEYVRRRGGLNLGRRLEVGLAQVQLMMARIAGDKKLTLEDFMLHEGEPKDMAADQPKDGEPISFEALTAMLSATAPRPKE